MITLQPHAGEMQEARYELDNITNESLALALMLVVVAILLAIKKNWRWRKIFSGASGARNSADYCRLCAEVYFQRG